MLASGQSCACVLGGQTLGPTSGCLNPKCWRCDLGIAFWQTPSELATGDFEKHFPKSLTLALRTLTSLNCSWLNGQVLGHHYLSLAHVFGAKLLKTGISCVRQPVLRTPPNSESLPPVQRELFCHPCEPRGLLQLSLTTRNLRWTLPITRHGSFPLCKSPRTCVTVWLSRKWNWDSCSSFIYNIPVTIISFKVFSHFLIANLSSAN